MSEMRGIQQPETPQHLLEVRGVSSSGGGGLDARLVPLATSPVVPVSPLAAAEGGGGQDNVQERGSIQQGSDTALPDTYTQFFDGYRSAGGQDDERIDALIWCESSWRIDPGGWHLGLAQFDPGTWATVSAITGYTDWLDPFSQGFNVAVWASMISPGTSAGWPSCFYAIDW